MVEQSKIIGLNIIKDCSDRELKKRKKREEKEENNNKFSWPISKTRGH